ncbi:ABC transporter permease [soil metagenome]
MTTLATGPRSASLRAPSERTTVLALRWGTVALAVLAWELVCRGPLADNGYLASPSQVVLTGLPAIAQSEPLAALGHTTARFLAAFAITALLGTLSGLLAGRAHRQTFAGVRDVVSVLYSLPMAPFSPLFVIWLGLGPRSEVAFGVIHGVIPVVLLTMTASAAVPESYVSAGRAMGAGRLQRLLLVLLPAVTPQLVTALKIGAALSLLGILLAELMISVGGVGSFIASRISSQQGAALDAMVLVVCVGALAVNAALSAAERRASRWQTQRS